MSDRPDPRTRQFRTYLAGMCAGFAGLMVVVSVYVTCLPMRVFDQEYPMWLYTTRCAGGGPAPEGAADAQVIILGDSRAKAAIIPKAVSDRCVSLTLGGATPIEAYLVLRDYLAHQAPPRLAIVSITPMHMASADAFWHRSVKFGFVGWREFADIAQRSVDVGDPIFQPRWVKLPLFACFKVRLGPLCAPEVKASLFAAGSRADANDRMYQRMVQQRGHVLFGKRKRSSALSGETRHEQFHPSPLFESYLDDLIKLAGQHDVKVAVLLMPVNASSLGRISEPYRRGVAEMLARLAAAHPQCVVDKEIWSLPDDCFGDASHVNQRGAAIVSQRVRQVAEDLGINVAQQRQAVDR